MSRESSPALIIHFPEHVRADTRDRLVALLSDFDPVAIHEDDPAAPRAWTAHFASTSTRQRAADAIRASDEFSELDITPVEIEDEDWARRTQADLPAVRIGRIIVAPPWDLPGSLERHGGPDAPVVVEIEPSRGFGTGHHQSTRLCLALLQAREIAGRTMIDVGTGSGVLSIAAAKLGAAAVAAIDADPDAIDSARENIVRNAVDKVVQAHVGDVATTALAPADIVTANLTGTLLARYAPQLTPLVRRGGILIVAGLTVDERQLVLDAFSGMLDVSESAEEDDWWAYVLVRR